MLEWSSASVTGSKEDTIYFTIPVKPIEACACFMGNMSNCLFSKDLINQR